MITKPILRIENIVNVLIIVSFLLSIGATTVECQQNTKNPICDREKFKIGVLQGEAKPFIFVIEKEQKKQTRKVGFDIDLMNKILIPEWRKECQNRNMQFYWEEAPFYELFDRLRDKQYDMIISSISINIPTPGRVGVTYSYPYYQDAGLVLAINSKDNTLKDTPGNKILDSLQQRNIYVQRGTTSHEYALKELKKSKIKYPKERGADVKSVFNLAREDEKGVIIYDYPILQYLLEIEKDTLYRNWEIYKPIPPTEKGDSTRPPYFLTREQYGIAVRADDNELLYEINKILTNYMAEIVDLKKKWFVPKPDSSNLQPVSKAQTRLTHLNSWKEAFSKLTISGGYGRSTKGTDEKTFKGSVEWLPFFTLKTWFTPDTWQRVFMSGLEISFIGTSFEQSVTIVESESIKVTTELFTMNFTLIRGSITSAAVKIKPFVTFSPIGYLKEKKKAATATISFQGGVEVPITDKMGIKVTYDRRWKYADKFSLSDFNLKPILTSLTVGISMKPF